jgi:hypothetical protein
MYLGAIRKTFKSPVYKLVEFFKRSRDGWKEKAAVRAYKIKLLSNRIKFLERSRDTWKEHAQDAESRCKSLHREVEKQKR